MRLMGVPPSEVGYIPAMPRREDHEVYKDMWSHWENKKQNKKGTKTKARNMKFYCFSIATIFV